MEIYKSSIKKFKLACDYSGDYQNFKNAKICSSNDAFEFVKFLYDDSISIFESFYILLLNNANNTIGYAKISQGGINSCIVDPIIIAKIAVDSLAKGVILFHNHPSGNLNPSDNDIKLTAKIKNALLLFDIKVLDHLILSDESFYSFSDNGGL